MQQRKSADPTRILAWLPDVRGVVPSPSILTDAGLPCVICDGAADLVRGIVEGAGAVLVTDEVLTSSARELLVVAIAQQPPWSDIPVVLLSHAASGAPCGDAFERLGNVTVLDCPVRSTTIVSVLRAALATRRRQYELRDHLHTRALHAAIVESSDDAIMSRTTDGVILSWNQAAERLFGYTAAEAIGRSVMAIVPTARRGEEARLLECIRAGEHVSHVETVRQAKDGRLVDVAVSTSPIVDDAGRVVGASSITRDVTAQKRAEASRRRRADRRRLLWESAALLLTGDSREAMMQALFARIAPPLRLDHYAYFTTAGDAPLRLEASAGVRGPGAPGRDSIAVLRALCAVVAREREPIVSGQRRSDGGGLEAPGLEPLGSRAFAALPLVVRGRAAGVLVFGGRTREPFEPDEVDFFETICHYVTATHERLRLIERLREADRRKDEFLATLAHELRNPLAPIRNALTIIRLRPDDAGRVRQARGLMDRQLDQMVRLIDDLLDVSRITRGKLVLRRERVTLDAVVSSAVDTSQPLVDAGGHRLTVSLPAEPIWLDADPVRLAQVFSNLLNNAAKYMERGGDVTLAATVVDRQVAVSVRDTGMGIPGDALGQIFDMFSQVGPTNDRTRAGLGIGLTLVKRLVELHGGDVTVSSGGPGAGTEFVVRLPVARPDTPASRERAARPDDARVGRCRVLVADDNQDSAESMAVILRMMGHEVRTVHDGIQAVDEAGAFRPDLVLLDIGMPQVDGYEAARRIRAQPWGRAVALVALTGWGQDEDRHRAIEAGFDRHFTKPIDIEEIEKLIAGISASRSAPEGGGTGRP